MVRIKFFAASFAISHRYLLKNFSVYSITKYIFQYNIKKIKIFLFSSKNSFFLHCQKRCSMLIYIVI